MLRAGIVVATLVALPIAFCELGSAQESDAEAVEARQQIDDRVDETLAEFLKSVEDAQALYDRAAGYAVFRVTKAGLGASGAGGTGAAVNKSTGQRVYMKMGAGSLGFTFGVSRYDIVILFETADRWNAFATGGWDAAATAQAAAGSQHAGASSSFFNGVAYFQLSNKGLMASADVSGTRFWVDKKLN